MRHQPTIGSSGKFSAFLVSAFIAAVIAGCSFPGMKLLRMEVYQGDELVLRTLFDAPDSEGPAYLWQRAGEEPFASEEEVAQVESDADDPLRATITGTVRVRILHVDNVQTSAALTGLTLVRDSSESSKWYLPESEVQRAKQAAGL